MNVHLYADPTQFGNENLVIGTPEYNSIRYPYYEGVKPGWKKNLESELAAKAKGTFKYKRMSDGQVMHRAGNSLCSDISDCIGLSLHIKTKSFEYVPSSGNIYLYGQYAARFDRANCRIASFTLKNINTKESRYRLQSLGLRLFSKKGKTYWRIQFGEQALLNIISKFGSVDEFKFSFRNVFPSIVISTYESEIFLVRTLTCELKEDIVYPIWSRPENGVREISAASDIYRSTDILDSDRYYRDVDVHDDQMLLEL